VQPAKLRPSLPPWRARRKPKLIHHRGIEDTETGRRIDDAETLEHLSILGPQSRPVSARPNSFRRLAPLLPPCPLCLCGEIFSTSWRIRLPSIVPRRLNRIDLTRKSGGGSPFSIPRSKADLTRAARGHAKECFASVFADPQSSRDC